MYFLDITRILGVAGDILRVYYKYIIYKELPNNIRFKYLKYFQSQLDNILDWNKEIEFSPDTYNKKM